MLKLPAALAEQNAELIAAVDGLVERHGNDRGAILPILQELLATWGEIGDLAMQLVADRLGVSPSQVQGVVTFYSFLGVGSRGRHVIRLCRTLSCVMAGNAAVAAAFETELGISFGATTPDGLFTLEWANCIGLCDAPPAALVDDAPRVALTPVQVGDLVATLRAADERA